MVEFLLRLERLTEELVQRLDTVTFAEMMEFMERRERLITELQEAEARDAGSDKTLCAPVVERILRYDPMIVGKMNALKHEASEAMGKFSVGRMQRNAYDAPYTPDSLYFDKKKITVPTLPNFRWIGSFSFF